MKKNTHTQIYMITDVIAKRHKKKSQAIYYLQHEQKKMKLSGQTTSFSTSSFNIERTLKKNEIKCANVQQKK